MKVDPATGAVSAVGALDARSAAGATPSPWRTGYAGGVAGGIPRGSGMLVHVLQHALDGTFAVVQVDLSTGAVASAATMLLGVNAELNLMTSAYVGA